VANTFLTPDIVAREALVLLRSNLASLRTFSRRYEADMNPVAKVGESVRVRRRSVGVVDEYNGSTITIRDIKETSIPVQIEKHFDASIALTGREQTMSLNDFSSQVIEPHMIAMGEKLDQYAISKILDLPNIAMPADTSGPGTLPQSPADWAQLDRTLNELKVPNFPRVGIVSPKLKALIVGQANLTRVNEAGASDALRRAMIGEYMGFDLLMGQNVPSSTFNSGTMTSAVVNVAGGLASGATSIVYDGANGATVTLKAGDIITIAGNKYVVAANVTSVLNAGTITLRAPTEVAIADDAAITVYDGGNNGRQCHGAIFHPDAFVLVAPPLVAPMSANSYTITDPETNIGLRVVMDYDRALKADVISIDCLVGARVVDGRLGAQIFENV
jgi:hypothetical protein